MQPDGPPRAPIGARSTSVVWAAVAVFTAIVVALIALEAVEERNETLATWHDRLASIARHQERLLSIWLAERRADALVLASFPTIRAAVGADEGPHAAPPEIRREHLGRILANIARSYRYEGIWLFDRRSNPVIRHGAAELSEPAATGLARAALAANRWAVASLGGAARPRFAVTVPVPDDDGPSAIGVIAIIIDPREQLVPLLAAEASGARSAASVLVHRRADGAQALPLFATAGDENGVQTAPGITEAALARHAGFGSYVDGAGTAVLAATRPLPDLGWGLAVTIDRSEAFVAWRDRVWLLSAIGGLVILAGVAVGQAVSRRRQAHILAGELARERVLLQARERSEAEIRRLNAELEQRVRERTAALEAANRELESFNYSVSHDLRAPLRHIDGYVRILEEDFAPALPDDAARYIGRIVVAVRRMSELIDALLQLSRLGRAELRRQSVDLRALVGAVYDELRAHEPGRRVDFAVAALPVVSGDPVLLRQLFENLLANALKFTRPRAHAHVAVGVTEHDGRPAFFVRDDGVGFDPEYADKLFAVFQRLHGEAEFEGHGVGLSIVRRIVEKHGGSVWAVGARDRGATVFFTLAPPA